MLMDLFFASSELPAAEPLGSLSGASTAVTSAEEQSGLSPPPPRKRRVHFHQFMLEMHRRVHALKVAHKAEQEAAAGAGAGAEATRTGGDTGASPSGSSPSGASAPSGPAARGPLQAGSGSVKRFLGQIDRRPERNALRLAAAEVAAEATLLCFDEFQVGLGRVRLGWVGWVGWVGLGGVFWDGAKRIACSRG